MNSKQLFEPLKIRGLVVKNRICVPPMVTFGLSDNSGQANHRHIEHYRSIAAGGAGLIIMEATCVTKDGRLAEDQLGIWSDTHVEGLKKVVTAVHQEDCPILLQIHHAGVVGISRDPLCPDAYPLRPGVTARKMSIADIHEVQDAFIQGGCRAYQGGFDGVELHGCHSYLISQFMNARVNRRDDIYGREPQRFITEIIEKLREQVPSEFVIGIRLGAFEPTLEAGIQHARLLEQQGGDFINVSYGFTQEQDAYAPKGFPFKDVIYAAGEIKKHCQIPVFAVNSIFTPRDAREVLEITEVDMVCIGRGILVDSEWPNKVRNGEMPLVCLNCRECQWHLSRSAYCPGRKKKHKIK